MPLTYLKSLFGNAVEKALNTIEEEKAKKENSELIDLLISRKWHDMFKPFHQSPI